MSDELDANIKRVQPYGLGVLGIFH